MVYCQQMFVYVPVAYELMMHMNEQSYYKALTEITQINCGKISVNTFTADFEDAFLNMEKLTAANPGIVTHTGFSFHFKQQIGRYLEKKLKFQQSKITDAMEHWGLDLLCIIPHDEAPTFGLEYVQTHWTEFVTCPYGLRWFDVFYNCI